MAICFVRSRYVSRKTGGNACRSSAYNARTKITCERTNELFDFTKRGGNVYHEVLLPNHVDEKFKNISLLSNEIENMERRKDSQLYVEWVLALPKEEEVTLAMKTEIVHRFIEYKGWLAEGLGVQINIHEPDEEDINWHAHLLFTTRRFNEEGTGFEQKKARDLQPKVAYGKVVEETEDNIAFTAIQNEYFKECGLDLKVDLPGEITQKHIGPVRMRKVLCEASMRHEEIKIANEESLNSGEKVLQKITKYMSIFNKNDILQAVANVENKEVRERLVKEALMSKSLLTLHHNDGSNTGHFTTRQVRKEEEKLLRLGDYVYYNANIVKRNSRTHNIVIRELTALSLEFRDAAKLERVMTKEQHTALSHVLLSEGGMKILRGRAGTGKSHILGKLKAITDVAKINTIGLAPTHKARIELADRGYEHNDTIKGFLFKLHSGRIYLRTGSLLVVDEAAMVGNDDLTELLRVAAARKCNVILSGDERQLSSVQRGGMFEVFMNKYGSTLVGNIQRQDKEWARSVAMAFSNNEVAQGLDILQKHDRIISRVDALASKEALLKDWSESSASVENKLIITVKNKDVMALNHGAREYLKQQGKITGEEIAVNGHHYAKGDRILIKETDRDLGVINGDFAEVISVSKRQFVIAIKKDGDEKGDQGKQANGEGKTGANDNVRILKFNPRVFSGFAHGYAATVFKSQGASIKDVFVYHDGFAGIRNSYVALSRCVSDMKLYINNVKTRNMGILIKQLSFDPDRGSSLTFATKEEIDRKLEEKIKRHEQGIFRSAISGIAKYTGNKIMRFADKHLPVSEYYQYKEPAIKMAEVDKVMKEVTNEIEQQYQQLESYQMQKIAVGENYNSRKYNYQVRGDNPTSAGNGYETARYEKTHGQISETGKEGKIADKINAVSKIDEKNQDTVIQAPILNGKIADNRDITVEKHSKNIDTAENMPKDIRDDSTKAHVKELSIVQDSQLTQNSKDKQNTHNGQEVQNIQPQEIKKTPNGKFYARVDKSRAYEDKIAKMQLLKEEWDRESERLRYEVKFKAEAIARDLLGFPNERLSSGDKLRWGDTGKFVVCVRGEKAGAWYDFGTGDKGDLFTLVQQKMGCDFNGAKEYLRGYVGMSSITNLKLVNDYRNQEQTEKYIKDQAAKIKQAQKLYARAKEITSNNIAYKYLSTKRGISCNLSDDIRTTGIYQKLDNSNEANINDKDSKKGAYYPALIAFARDGKGEITGGQHILLDKDTASKANVDIAKRSFGKIAGSFVDMGNISINNTSYKTDKTNDDKTNASNAINISDNINNSVKTDKITIIAEGVETALSVKQALMKDKDYQNLNLDIKILCSLGVSNTKNYKASRDEKIIIAADNDGKDSITHKTIEKAKTELEYRGAFIEIVRPKQEGDFNDILKQDVARGEKEIQNLFKGAIMRHSAKTLKQYFAADEFRQKDITEDSMKGNVGNIDSLEKGSHTNLEVDNKLISESLKTNCYFLLKNEVIKEDKLLMILRKSNNVKETNDFIYKKCQEFAIEKAKDDINIIKILDSTNKGNEAIKTIIDKNKDHQEYMPYLKGSGEEAGIKHFANRAKADEIFKKHVQAEPEQVNRFKEEVRNMSRFNEWAKEFSQDNMASTLKIYQEQGLKKATEFAYEKNRDFVLNKLESQDNILISDINSGIKPDTVIKGREYITAIAKDKQIMAYVDKALSEGKEFKNLAPNHSLADYAKERDQIKANELSLANKAKSFGDDFER